jgi:hypothetical protein
MVEPLGGGGGVGTGREGRRREEIEVGRWLGADGRGLRAEGEKKMCVNDGCLSLGRVILRRHAQVSFDTIFGLF